MSADEQALEMLDAFASVRAQRFDLTFTDIAGDKVGFRGNRTLDQLRGALPAILEDAAGQLHNVIVRPRSTGLIQLDDLGEAVAERLRPVSFLVLRTSPSKFQAWVAVADADDFATLHVKRDVIVGDGYRSTLGIQRLYGQDADINAIGIDGWTIRDQLDGSGGAGDDRFQGPDWDRRQRHL